GRTMEQLGVKVRIAVGVSSGYVLPTFRSTLGPAADRWFVVGGWNPDIPGARALAEEYKQKYNTDMNEASALAYQTTWVLKEAIEQAKSTDHEKINDALHQLKIAPGPLLIMPYSNSSLMRLGKIRTRVS